MARLVVDHGEVRPVLYELVGDVITIGRDPSNNVAINDPTISAQHASLTRSPTGYRLKDLGSTNGTQWNGVLITDAELKDGDKIRFGSVAAVFQDTAAKFDQTEPLEEASAPRGEARALTDSRVSRKKAFRYGRCSSTHRNFHHRLGCRCPVSKQTR